MTETFPVQILIDELKNEETQHRLNAVRRLSTIAKALGVERTRSELVPYLNESLDDEDEVLLALSDELSRFVPLVGGSAHAACLLAPLQTLACVEEVVVRDQTVVSLRVVIEALGTSASAVVVELLSKLAGGAWHTSRTSAAGLFDCAYPKVDAAGQAKLRSLFAALAADEAPMVRRAAAANLGKFGGVVGAALVRSELHPLFTALAGDDQDSVRLLAVENCVLLARALGSAAAVTELVLPTIKQVAGDGSWRVRYMVADQFCQLC